MKALPPAKSHHRLVQKISLPKSDGRFNDRLHNFGQQFLTSLSAEGRLAVSIMAAMVLFLILPDSLYLNNQILISWIGGVLCFLTLIMRVIGKATPEQTRHQVQCHESERSSLFLLVVLVACISIFAIALMQSNSQGLSLSSLSFKVILSLTAVVCSWFLTHVMFALHYATCYYQRDLSNPTGYAGGLLFPCDAPPNYWDFLYFSFVLGMTAQTSDVMISSPSLRLTALGHGMVGFLFSLVILAASVNVASGLI